MTGFEPLVSEATAIPNEPQPLPNSTLLSFMQQITLVRTFTFT